MPRCLVLQSGYVISERDDRILLDKIQNACEWRVLLNDSGYAKYEIIPLDAINTVIEKPYRSDLPCSTYFQQSSLPANSAAAMPSPTLNTHKIQQLALRFQQELLQSLSAQVILMQELLDVKSEP